MEGWLSLFRRDAFAGQSFAHHDELETATTLATAGTSAKTDSR